MKPPSQKRQDWIRGRRQKRKLARQARLRRQVFRYTLLSLLVFAGIAGFAYLPWSLQNADTDIEIHGNQVVSDEQVRAALENALHKPVYKLDPARLERNVCQLAAVKYAFVRRYALPHPKLRVEVLEEFPWATLVSTPDGPPEAVISQTGRVIPIDQFPRVVQPPLRICAGSNLKLTPLQIAEWDGWVRLIAEQTQKPVSLVDMRQPAAIEIVCGNLDLHVGQADSGLTRRLNRLASVVPVVATLQHKLKFIDLSLDSNVPLKLDKSAATAAKDDEILRQAIRSVGANPDATNPTPAM